MLNHDHKMSQTKIAKYKERPKKKRHTDRITLQKEVETLFVPTRDISDKCKRYKKIRVDKTKTNVKKTRSRVRKNEIREKETVNNNCDYLKYYRMINDRLYYE